MSQDAYKQRAAEAAIEFVESGSVIGVGTGSTVNHFIEALGRMRQRIDGAVSHSLEGATLRDLVLAKGGRPQDIGQVPDEALAETGN